MGYLHNYNFWKVPMIQWFKMMNDLGYISSDTHSKWWLGGSKYDVEDLF